MCGAGLHTINGMSALVLGLSHAKCEYPESNDDNDVNDDDNAIPIPR